VEAMSKQVCGCRRLALPLAWATPMRGNSP
jgi:hypothetical protein